MAVLIALIAVGGWTLWQQSLPDSESQTLPVWTAFEPAQVRDITLAGGGASPTHLKRQGEQWMLLPESDVAVVEQAVAADDEAVDHLLADLAYMQPVRIVTRHAEHFSRLGVDAANGMHVVLRDLSNAILLDILVGTPATDLISTYVRRQGDDEAVAVNRSLTWQIKRTHQAWQAQPASPAPVVSDER